MNKLELRARARKYTRTNETNYVDADLDSDLNVAYGEVQIMVHEAEGYTNSDVDFREYDLISTDGLVSGDIGFNGEYPLPLDMTSLISIDISYDEDEGWNPADIIYLTDSEYTQFAEGQYNVTYSETSPKVFIARNSAFVRPVKTTAGDITDGIRITINAVADELTSDLAEPNFDPRLHNLIPLKIAQDYALFLPEKYNAKIDKKVMELEMLLYSIYESKIPFKKRIIPKREEFGSIRTRNRYTN